MANSVDPDQTAPVGAVCSGSTLFASILNSSVMLGNYLQQTTFSDAFFLGALRVTQENTHSFVMVKLAGNVPTLISIMSLYAKSKWSS